MGTGSIKYVGILLGGAGGMIVGYTIGSEAVEHADTLFENPDVLSYVVSKHPSLTKLLTALVTGGLIGKIGGVIGSGLDSLVGNKDL